MTADYWRDYKIAVGKISIFTWSSSEWPDWGRSSREEMKYADQSSTLFLSSSEIPSHVAHDSHASGQKREGRVWSPALWPLTHTLSGFSPLLISVGKKKVFLYPLRFSNWGMQIKLITYVWKLTEKCDSKGLLEFGA